MNIAIPVFQLGHTGGVERYTLQVGAELARRGHTVTFVSPRPDQSPPPGTSVHEVWGPRSKSTLVHLADQATFGIRSTWPTRRSKAGTVVYRPLGGNFGPGVVTAHSCHAAWLRDQERFLGSARKTPLDRILLAQEKWTFGRASILPTTVSESCANDIVKHYGVERGSVAIAPPAIDSEEFAPRTEAERRQARKELGLDGDRLVVGIVANHAFLRKRVDLAIRAAALTGSTLLVAGKPDVDETTYRRLAEKTGADIRFFGLVAEMTRFYRALDAFVLPSIHESYGMAVHEAMATGVASIVGHACGIASMLDDGQNALILHHYDAQSLASQLDRLSDESVRARLASKGSMWAHLRTWSDVVDDLAPSLEVVADSGG